ncbi:hypothetical protein NSU_2994 [Novosphingobium pentaromativorans US6-1]|uniref:Uncharacterized protein n=1 Tax=Novosphingobium pentaromativorans US6-1 TaxID=1088721 RepID=G6EF73_9SPHN|nr:hypothetical protein NSU_2994 [Novosphingobium pentaromativorans US6-1]
MSCPTFAQIRASLSAVYDMASASQIRMKTCSFASKTAQTI